MAKPEIENFGRIADVGLSDIPALADCNCGMEPVEYNLIIAPAEQKAQIGSIFIPDESKEKLGLAKQIGRIVAASPIAFNYDAWPAGSHPPGVGDVVWFARYAGGEFEGADGRTYRIIKDKDIGAVISRAAAYSLANSQRAAAAMQALPQPFSNQFLVAAGIQANNA